MGEAAFARRDDPWTSWAAAQSLPDLRGRQAAVLFVLGQAESATLEELVRAYRQWEGIADLPLQSDSGIRTRCSELQDRGLVVDTGLTRKTESGRSARVLVRAHVDPDEVLNRWPDVDPDGQLRLMSEEA